MILLQVHCDLCNERFVTDIKNQEEARRLAKEQGWDYKNKRDLCPNHAQARKRMVDRYR